MEYVSIQPIFTLPPREIYILAGESDMSGRGLLSEVPAFANAGRVKVFSNAWQWVGGAEPTDSATGQVDAVSNDGSAAACSPGMSFGTELAALRSGVEIGLVPCAKGGSKMADWARNLSRSTLYGSMIARAKEAAKTGTLKGVLWWQGKNDENDLAAANAWGANCATLISNIRSDLAIADLAVIVIVIDNQTGVADSPYVGTIQTQQRAVSGTGIAKVETAGMTMKSGDPVHLATAGQIVVGQRCATAMQGLL